MRFPPPYRMKECRGDGSMRNPTEILIRGLIGGISDKSPVLFGPISHPPLVIGLPGSGADFPVPGAWRPALSVEFQAPVSRKWAPPRNGTCPMDIFGKPAHYVFVIFGHIFPAIAKFKIL